MNPESTIRLLQGRGHRMTAARRFIISALCEATSPLAATDLLKHLDKHKLHSNKTTVYRELAFLTEQNVVKSIDFGDGARRFEITDGAHHHHFICNTCKTVFDVNLKNDLEAEEALLEKSHGVKIDSHSLEFFGKCKNCS